MEAESGAGARRPYAQTRVGCASGLLLIFRRQVASWQASCSRPQDKGTVAMARSGGRSQWEREMAAQRREAERQAREQARLAKEREKARQQRHIQAQQRAAERKTAGVEEQVKTLDEILTGVLSAPALTFDSLKVAPELRAFDPGHLGTAEPAPDWTDYEPPGPGVLSRLFGGVARHERQTAERAEPDSIPPWLSIVSERLSAQRALSAARAAHQRRLAGGALSVRCCRAVNRRS